MVTHTKMTDFGRTCFYKDEKNLKKLTRVFGENEAVVVLSAYEATEALRRVLSKTRLNLFPQGLDCCSCSPKNGFFLCCCYFTTVHMEKHGPSINLMIGTSNFFHVSAGS